MQRLPARTALADGPVRGRRGGLLELEVPGLREMPGFLRHSTLTDSSSAALRTDRSPGPDRATYEWSSGPGSFPRSDAISCARVSADNGFGSTPRTEPVSGSGSEVPETKSDWSAG